jgi:hypothetical protein
MEHNIGKAQILFCISGYDSAFVTPLLQAPSKMKCPDVNNTTNGCIRYPISRLQKQDVEKGLDYFFEVYIYNLAGLFTTVHSTTFQVPSKFPPGNGTVLDLDPSNGDNQTDVDFHFTLSSACGTWSGFLHHMNVTIEVGVGSRPRQDDVIQFVRVDSNAHMYCFHSILLSPNNKYYFTTKASCTGGMTVVSSDGFVNINKTDAITHLFIENGVRCSSNNLLETVTITGNKSHLDEYIIHTANALDVGNVYSIQTNPTVEIFSHDIIWLNTNIYFHNRTRRAFRTTSPRPTFRVSDIDHSVAANQSISISNCNEDFNFQSSSETYNAYWTLDPPLDTMVTHFEIAIVKKGNNLNTSDHYIFISDIGDIGKRLNYSARNLNLIDGDEYSMTVKACFGINCLSPKASPWIRIQSSPPFSGTINATIEDGEDCLSWKMGWEPFVCSQNPVGTPATAYQWTVALEETGQGTLMEWSAPLKTTNRTYMEVSLDKCSY